MKKFKHKYLPLVAEERINDYKVENRDKNTKMIESMQIVSPKCSIESSTDWEKIVEKKLIFLSEDKVPIYENDQCWLVSQKGDYEVSCFGKIYQDFSTNNYTNYIFFSTREAAIEYAKWRKPILSRFDLQRFGTGTYSPSDYKKYQEFIEEKLAEIK